MNDEIMSIVVAGYKDCVDAEKSKYTSYQIRIVLSDGRNIVFDRRFSEFSDLHQVLLRCEISDILDFQFPSKITFGVRPEISKQKRLESFDYYVKLLVGSVVLFYMSQIAIKPRPDVVSRFLQLNNNNSVAQQSPVNHEATSEQTVPSTPSDVAVGDTSDPVDVAAGVVTLTNSDDKIDFPPLPPRDMTVTQIIISSFVITCLLTACMLAYDGFDWLLKDMRLDHVVVLMTTVYVIIVYVRVVQLRKEYNI